jgi:hypothetical protein
MAAAANGAGYMDNNFGANALEVLKWVGIVFAAGFVGYFGRYLAKRIIAGCRKDDAAKAREQLSAAALACKVEKKRFKQAVKTVKKAGDK